MNSENSYSNVSIVKIKGVGTAIKGLMSLFEEAKSKTFRDEDELVEYLLRGIKEKNTISEKDEKQLKEVLPGKYERFLEGKIDDEEKGPVVDIKLLGSGARGYFELEKEAMNAVVELDVNGPFKQIRDLEEIAKYGVIPMPALIINGKIVSSGRIVKKEEIKKLIREAISKEK